MRVLPFLPTYSRILGLACIVSLPLASACGTSSNDDPVLGGACEPVIVPGTFTVTSIETSPANDATCGSAPQLVSLSFAPSASAPDPGAQYAALESASGRLTVSPADAGSDEDPPSSCLTSLGIKVGTTLNGTRTINTAGSCAPSYDTFDLDLTSCVCS